MDRFTIKRLQALYALESGIKDVYVEGSFDKRLLTWIFKSVGASNVKVLEIASVDVPAEFVINSGLNDGSRGRLIALSYIMSSSLEPESRQVTCIADMDFDAVRGTQHNARCLMLTDYCCMESYLFNVDTLQRFLDLVIGKELDANTILMGLAQPLLELFLFRAANEELKLGLKWQKVEKACEVSGGTLKLKREELLTKYLSSKSKITERAKFEQTVESLRSKVSSDVRQTLNGHDFLNLLAVFLMKILPDRFLKDVAGLFQRSADGEPETLARCLVNGVVVASITTEQMFQTLLQKVARE